MKKLFTYLLITAMVLTLCSCSHNENSHKPDIASEKSSPSATNSDKSGAEEVKTKQLSYPYVDTEGRTRYQLYINGKLVKTKHDPYTYANKPKGAYYPIVEIFEYLGVECLFDKSVQTLTTKINGTVITCSTGNKDISVGKKTLGGTAPEYIDDCFFVPSYTFMELLDAVVDFNNDRSGVTIKTNLAINPATSGIRGLSISTKAANDIGKKVYSGPNTCTACGGTGRSYCSRCSGTGFITQYLQTRNPATGQMTITSTKTICMSCSGSGCCKCHVCGGKGK